MKKITANIITYNEEESIRECLRSLEKVADEIVVVDSFSTDNTVKICEEMGCKVTQRRFNGYGAQKQYAVSLSTHSYILSVDADEVLNDDLQKSIIKLKESGFEHRIYSFSRLNFLCEVPIKHSGWFPDFQVRLFDKRYASWNLRDVQESVIFPGTLTAFPIHGLLLHYRCKTLEEYYSQEEKYATINAKILINQGRHPSLITPYIYSFLQYIRTYIFNRGFLDGKEGRIIALVTAKSVWQEYYHARRKINRLNT